MPSNHEESNSAKNYTAHTEVVQQDTSIGGKVGQGVSGVMKVIHGIGESIRGQAIDIADLGKGSTSGKTIAAEGKAETQEGLKEVGSSAHR
ncbi:hypothetical protein BC827DRAFT_1266732 [Russula dissimulans]|nr:hypothetical protein BC827DRAFT_1266732 [Russula dissimulans]